jgi:S-adenosylmethionine decarboxylase proenzyme
MSFRARHLLVEYHGCDPDVLDDAERIPQVLRQAAEAAGASIVGCCFHRFTPHGVSGTLLIEESHLSIHTWPERGHAAVDFYTCGEADPLLAHEVLRRNLGARSFELVVLRRSEGLPSAGIEVVDRRAEPAAEGRPATASQEPPVSGDPHAGAG